MMGGGSNNIPATAATAVALIANSFIYYILLSVVNDTLDSFKSNNDASIDRKPESGM